ncbi:HAD hydrolase family protein [Candidatus Peregrinibacteria bacterium]|nr:MAG: HAD hydrolase family protein [Candidatus Peregrinibacteria bacterium]
MDYFCDTKWTLKKYVIFLDIDGTLVGEGETKIDSKTKRAFDELKKNNFIVLCSNSPNKKRSEKMAKELKVLWNSGPHKKPNKEVLTYIKLPTNKKHAVIGNLHCIDGRFAKAIDAEFFPVKTLVNPKENWIDKIFYWIDSHLLSKCI